MRARRFPKNPCSDWRYQALALTVRQSSKLNVLKCSFCSTVSRLKLAAWLLRAGDLAGPMDLQDEMAGSLAKATFRFL